MTTAQHQQQKGNDTNAATNTIPVAVHQALGLLQVPTGAVVPPLDAGNLKLPQPGEAALAVAAQAPQQATAGATFEEDELQIGNANNNPMDLTTTPKKRKGSKNAGSKKGSKRVERPQSFWYRLCQLFEQGDYKSQVEFLRSPDSGDDVNAAHRMVS